MRPARFSACRAEFIHGDGAVVKGTKSHMAGVENLHARSRLERSAHALCFRGRWTRLRDMTELRWGEAHQVETAAGLLIVRAFPLQHWGDAPLSGARETI